MGGHDLTWITKVENGNVHEVLEQTITVNIVFKGIYDAIIYPKDDCNFFPRKSEYPDTIQFFYTFSVLRARIFNGPICLLFFLSHYTSVQLGKSDGT